MKTIILITTTLSCLIVAISGQNIQWNGNNWAMGCDFYNNDLYGVKAPGSDCSSICSKTASCTHFSWNSLDGGTCWLKYGSVTKNNAFASDPNMM